MLKHIHLKKVKSTQDIAKKLILESNSKYVLVSTDNQYQGRGRSNKVWQHSKGNICASLGFKFKNLKKLPFLQHLTALTLLDVIKNPDIAIKWPNDLYNLDKKIGGILVESESSVEDEVNVVIGVGLNTTSTPNLELFGTIGEKFFEIFENNNNQLLEEFVEKFDQNLNLEIDDNFSKAIQKICFGLVKLWL